MKPFYNVLSTLTTTFIILFFLYASFSSSTVAQTIEDQEIIKNARVDTTSAGIVTKVAPGELLPILIKLSNFGIGKKVDVIITYGVYNNKGEEIYAATETVAVETTASFIKTIQIPFGTLPGKHIAKAYITYKDQVAPAITHFPFTVEKKIAGLFESDFYLYGGIIATISIFMLFAGRIFIKYKKTTRLVLFDYSDIPHDERIFFELLSDTIMSMRQRAGDRALDIATGIDGLIIDKETGRVLKITESPSKIIASLVSRYEKILGKKVSFSFRGTG